MAASSIGRSLQAASRRDVSSVEPSLTTITSSGTPDWVSADSTLASIKSPALYAAMTTVTRGFAVIPFFNHRCYVKPGLTGWAQVNYPYGASVEDAREKLAYDLYYVKNRGMLLDTLILLATVRVILFGEGAR